MIRKLVVAIAIAAALAGFFVADLDRYLDLGYLKDRLDDLARAYESAPVAFAVAFFSTYVAAAALSIPGAAVLTLLAGAVFGLGTGLVLVSFASSIGATLAFVIARTLLRDTVERRFPRVAGSVNRGIARDGALYLLTLRLVPVFPFFAVNLTMGLTRFPVLPFYLVSQIGMLPGTAVYVNAGRELAGIERLGDVASPPVVAALALLGVFPLVARWCVDAIMRRRLYAPFERPATFDYNLVVIGAGAAGLVSAYVAATVRAKVALVESGAMGGDCLNTGCVPSKTLLKSARVAEQVAGAHAFGVEVGDYRVDFQAVMRRVRETVAAIAPNDSVERYTALGVSCLQGRARLVSPYEVDVDGRRITTRAIVIATGGRPAVPPIPGLAETGYYTSETIWSLTELPRRLVVLGAGPIGCELAQAFALLGADVTLVEAGARILPREDPDVAALMTQRFELAGVRIRTGTRADRADAAPDGEHRLHVTDADGGSSELGFDVLLVATGRRANTEGLGLEALGIPLADDGTVETDDTLRTRFPNIYACGDVAGPFQFTHTASHQAWYAAVNALFGSPVKRFTADYRVIPRCTYTHPEIASVGLNETEAERQDIEFEVTRYALSELDRAVTEGETEGFVKVLTASGRSRILGVTIVGEHAGETLAEFALAMKQRAGLGAVLGTVHAYPTRAEANRFVAGVWKKAHAPTRLLAVVGRWHAWRRRGRRDAV